MSPKGDSASLIGNRRGIALISSLLMTLLMTLVIVALAYRVQLFSSGSRDTVVKNQNVYTADVGINQARYFLLDQNCAMTALNEWRCMNGSLTIGDSFVDISRFLKNSFPLPMGITFAENTITYNTEQRTVTGSAGENYSYKVYAKASGIPDVINIVTVAERPGNPAKTVIDVGLKFNVKIGDDSIRSKNQGADGSGTSKEALGDVDSSVLKNLISSTTTPP